MSGRRDIERAVKRNGLTIALDTAGEPYVYWEPVGGYTEMVGPDGGWTVDIEGHGFVFGYNAAEVVEQIDALTAAEFGRQQ